MERLIVIVGPTAVGKTQVSIDLAKKLNTEIISGDSMLVYRSLNIGTAKPTPAEQQGIPHHLIDILEATEPFSVVDFQQQAGQLIHSINSQDRIPILAGGTGLYVKSLLEGYCFITICIICWHKFPQKKRLNFILTMSAELFAHWKFMKLKERR